MTNTDLNSEPFLIGMPNGVCRLPDGRSAVVAIACIPFMIYECEKVVVEAASRPRGERGAARAARLSASPRRAAALEQGRRRLGVIVANANSGQHSLASLRLAAGLSQSQLAEKMGTKQSNISRWEKSPGELRSDSIRRLAGALGVTPETVFSVILSAPESETVDA